MTAKNQEPRKGPGRPPKPMPEQIPDTPGERSQGPDEHAAKETV